MGEIHVRGQWTALTDALVEMAVMSTLSTTTFLERTKKLFQHGESLRWSPLTSMLVALSATKRIGR
jgi:hypothetical protein